MLRSLSARLTPHVTKIRPHHENTALLNNRPLSRPRKYNLIQQFSSYPAKRNKQTPQNGKQHPLPNGNPEMPKFSLDGLGISKNMKVALIVLVSILGTMETWTYYTWWQNWYYEDNKRDS